MYFKQALQYTVQQINCDVQKLFYKETDLLFYILISPIAVVCVGTHLARLQPPHPLGKAFKWSGLFWCMFVWQFGGEFLQIWV